MSNKSIIPRESKSFRQQKSDELFSLASKLEDNSLSMNEQSKLIDMLNKSAQNLMDIQDNWMIEDKTKETLKECIMDAFFCLQEGIGCMKDDPWQNEWRCDFSNRIMHKSLPLQQFRKDLIHAQRTTYNVLRNIVDNPFEYLVESSPEGFGIEDMNFHINDYWKK